ncbi:MAG: hypothetical protein DID90_2727552789 [Candidatus Nitrotoga sp. LAW]|nr:MAG: hypothetical protein DID90_2727552789 [Candidatus Nitrotoga sp. LAW]
MFRAQNGNINASIQATAKLTITDWMSHFNFTAGHIILMLAFKGGNLRIVEYKTLIRNFGFQCAQAAFEILKFVPQPNRADATLPETNTPRLRNSLLVRC